MTHSRNPTYHAPKQAQAQAQAQPQVQDYGTEVLNQDKIQHLKLMKQLLLKTKKQDRISPLQLLT